LPSLTERVGDIPILVQFFLKKYNEAYGKQLHGLTRRAQAVLMQHSWPGNVRELENVISAPASLLPTTSSMSTISLSTCRNRRARRPWRRDWRPLPLEEVRRLHIQRVLEMCEGNRVRAAQVLGLGAPACTATSNARPRTRPGLPQLSSTAFLIPCRLQRSLIAFPSLLGEEKARETGRQHGRWFSSNRIPPVTLGF